MRYLRAVGLTFVPILKILISLLDSSLKRVEVYSGTGAMGQQQTTGQDHPLTTLSSALMATTYLLGRIKVKQGKRHNYGHHSYSRINQGKGGFRLFNSYVSTSSCQGLQIEIFRPHARTGRWQPDGVCKRWRRIPPSSTPGARSPT